jgi:hypothetical protein
MNLNAIVRYIMVDICICILTHLMFNSSEECDGRNTMIQVFRPFSEHQQKFTELLIQHPFLVIFCILPSETFLLPKQLQ